jgi:hypothetical protein
MDANLEDFEYDLAISFCAEDEETADEIASLLSPRYSVFIYSKKQDKLAGNDGEKVFNEVFGRKSRFVIVLYRNEWGKTPWTRIEENAIRSRAFDHGYNFVLFVFLDAAAKAPEYLPPAYIWHNYQRYGLESLSAIIEHKIVELGGEEKHETIEDRAQKKMAQLAFQQRRSEYLRSTDAIFDAGREFTAIWERVQTIVSNLKQKFFMFDLDAKLDGKKMVVIESGDFDAIIYNANHDNSELEVEVHKMKRRRHSSGPKSMRLTQRILKYDLAKSKVKGWTDQQTNKFYDSAKVAELAIDDLLENRKQ